MAEKTRCLTWRSFIYRARCGRWFKHGVQLSRGMWQDKHGGKPALFQIPVSILNGTTGKRMQVSNVEREAYLEADAGVDHCEGRRFSGIWS